MIFYKPNGAWSSRYYEYDKWTRFTFQWDYTSDSTFTYYTEYQSGVEWDYDDTSIDPVDIDRIGFYTELSIFNLNSDGIMFTYAGLTALTPSPTPNPTESPSTSNPTDPPTMQPTLSPSHVPSITPTILPTDVPSIFPTIQPTMSPLKFALTIKADIKLTKSGSDKGGGQAAVDLSTTLGILTNLDDTINKNSDNTAGLIFLGMILFAFRVYIIRKNDQQSKERELVRSMSRVMSVSASSPESNRNSVAPSELGNPNRPIASTYTGSNTRKFRNSQRCLSKGSLNETALATKPMSPVLNMYKSFNSEPGESDGVYAIPANHEMHHQDQDMIVTPNGVSEYSNEDLITGRHEPNITKSTDTGNIEGIDIIHDDEIIIGDDEQEYTHGTPGKALNHTILNIDGNNNEQMDNFGHESGDTGTSGQITDNPNDIDQIHNDCRNYVDNKAMLLNEELLEMQRWMAETCKFPQYFDIFVQNRYESLDLIVEITEKLELKEIGVDLPGHRTKILAEIKKLQINNANFKPHQADNHVLLKGID